jgi:hypothetical protein
MFLWQRELQYFPTRRDPPPDAVGLRDVTRLDLPTPDGETVVLWFSPARSDRSTVLFLHGNGGEIAFGRQLFDAARDPKTFLSLGRAGHAALSTRDL